MNNIDSLYRQVIMEHYKNPRNKGLVDDESYHTLHLKNPSCGDDIHVQVKFENNKITDVIFNKNFNGEFYINGSLISEEELKSKMLLLGYTDYPDFCEELMKSLDEQQQQKNKD